MHQPKLILAIDIGTSSVRAALFDQAAGPITKTFVKIERRLKATADGGSEIDADKAFRQMVEAIDAVLAKAEKLNGVISHIASCTFWHSLMGVDGGGKPTTPVYGWADNRSREQVSILRKKFDEATTHNRTGARFHSSFWPAKLMWLRKECPDVWEATAKWYSLGDYLTLKLCGETTTSVSMAAGTGVFDIRRCEWDAELLKYLKLNKAALPKIGEDGASVELSGKWQKRWPRLSDAKFLLPIADGVANNVGSGCVTSEKAALMVGTSGAMRVIYTGEPPEKIPEGLWCYRVDRKRVIVGGALSDGGGLYDWLKRNLRIDLNDKQIGREIERRGKIANGIEFASFLAGERSTGYNEYATGAISGLTMSHDAIDILQAAMESVAERFADIFTQLKTVCPITEIVASGGALDNSPIWQEMIAAAIGHELKPSNESEASLRGAVLLAVETTGKIEFADEDQKR